MANPLDPVPDQITFQARQPAPPPGLLNDQSHQPSKQSHGKDHTEQLEAASGQGTAEEQTSFRAGRSTTRLQRRIRVMEMKCYRKMLCISYRDPVTNEEVLNGQRKRVDFPAHARTVHNDLPRKKDWKRISAESSIMSPDNPIGQGTELNWTSQRTRCKRTRRSHGRAKAVQKFPWVIAYPFRSNANPSLHALNQI